MCRKHPLQDHGEREKKIKSLAKASASSFLKRSYEELIKGQLDKMEADANVGSKEECMSYKISMEEERDKASKREKRKFLSDEHEELSRRSGLNPAVLATMLAGSDSDSEENSNADKTKSSNLGEEPERRSKKSKKEKKEKKEKKSNKKERKSEKKKEKRKSKNHTSSSSESESEAGTPIRHSKSTEPMKTAVNPDIKSSSSKDSGSYYGLV
jgi:outer membrane biosynthesis protein TonB